MDAHYPLCARCSGSVYYHLPPEASQSKRIASLASHFVVSKCKVINRSKRTVLASDLEVAETTWARMKGLLGRRADQFSGGKGLWIVPSQGVHTIGMTFPIDVAYLNSKQQVIYVCHELAPFRFARLKLRARSVLELPAGTLARTQTAVGDSIEISEVETDGGEECTAD